MLRVLHSAPLSEAEAVLALVAALPPCRRHAGGEVPRSEERRVGKECRSLCDWSSDVCSSDLNVARPALRAALRSRGGLGIGGGPATVPTSCRRGGAKIGRASCRERV